MHVDTLSIHHRCWSQTALAVELLQALQNLKQASHNMQVTASWKENSLGLEACNFEIQKALAAAVQIAVDAPQAR